MVPYVQTSAAVSPSKGAAIINTERKTIAKTNTTTIIANINSQVKLSKVVSLMSLLIRSSDITP